MANPWGARTPFGRDREWPVRVDQFLEAGISEEDVDRWVQTASILHSNGDALDIAVKGGRIVGVRGRSANSVNRSKALLEEKGPLAFGFYTTGQLFLEEYYTLGVIGKAGLGTPHMDGNT